MAIATNSPTRFYRVVRGAWVRQRGITSGWWYRSQLVYYRNMEPVTIVRVTVGNLLVSSWTDVGNLRCTAAAHQVRVVGWYRSLAYSSVFFHCV